MSTSTQPAAEDALLNLMLGDATLGQVGPPQIFTPAALQREHIWISENSEETQQATLTAGTGAMLQREERFDIHVIVAIEKLGNDYLATRNRGVVLTAAVENLVRINFDLSDQVSYAEVTGILRRSAAVEKQRFVDYDITISCLSLLTGS